MDPVTIGILGGMMTVMMTIMMTVMIYLDRTRRADMNAGFARVDKRMDQLDTRMDRFDTRMDQLITLVIDLAKTVGEVKGRVGTSPVAESLAATE